MRRGPPGPETRYEAFAPTHDSPTPALGPLFLDVYEMHVCPVMCCAIGSLVFLLLAVGHWFLAVPTQTSHTRGVFDTFWNRSKRWGVLGAFVRLGTCRVGLIRHHCDEAGLCSLFQDELRISMSVWVLMAGWPRTNRLLIAGSGSNLDTLCTCHP